MESISNRELYDDRYMILRRDRDYEKMGETLGGGVVTAARRESVAESRRERCLDARV